MKTELNNTGILLADLNETEIKLAIELYKLATPDSIGIFEKNYGKYIGIHKGELDFWNGYGILFTPITLHQLAFESGLNPDWAEEIVHLDGGAVHFYGNNKYQYITPATIEYPINDLPPKVTSYPIIKKQTTKEVALDSENTDTNRLTSLAKQDFITFLIAICTYARGVKHGVDANWYHYPEDKADCCFSHHHWKLAEELGLAENVGSYKWIPTEKLDTFYNKTLQNAFSDLVSDSVEIEYSEW